MPFRTPLPPRISLLAGPRSIRRTPLPSTRTATVTPAAPYGDWRGTRAEDNAVDRSKKGDTTDPQTQGANAGLKEKKEGNGANDQKTSQATTERDQRQTTKKSEKEFPKAPRPIIGLTDERGEVSALAKWDSVGSSWLTCSSVIERLGVERMMVVDERAREELISQLDKTFNL